ncbi:MAG TPA: GNAT family N-acetyltransferase [Pseudonocardia sp.]|nr:GNAT family N-acetyltransferase [Pseudonocardia sp.]
MTVPTPGPTSRPTAAAASVPTAMPRDGHIAIAPIDPDDEAALRAWLDVERSVQAHDRPHEPTRPWAEHRARLAHPWPGEETRAWLATASGEAVGALELTLPVLDNLDNALVEITVDPAHRRRGVGGALLAHAIEEARSAGRRRIIAEAHEPLDDGAAPEVAPGAAFLRAAGARKALADRRRRLTIPVPDEPALTTLESAARERSVGYSVVRWAGPTPVEYLDDTARLTGRMSTDAPLDDLHWEPERYDAQRIRRRDAAMRARGIEQVAAAVREDASGRLVAFSVIGVHPEIGWHASQWDTIVDPPHRGMRLGALVKTANLGQLRARYPSVRALDTYNADSNPWMVSINEAMGFRPLDRLGEWELDLG